MPRHGFELVKCLSDEPRQVVLVRVLDPPGERYSERDGADFRNQARGRFGHAAPAQRLSHGLGECGARTSVVWLAPSVHGPTDRHGFVPRLVGIAREKGVSAYVGDGSNRWPAVHELDAARLFRLVLETAPAGKRWTGAGDEGVPFRQIAEVIGRHLNVPAVSISQREAAAHFGFLGALASLDIAWSSAETQERLGWRPTHPGLIADLEAAFYFDTRSA